MQDGRFLNTKPMLFISMAFKRRDGRPQPGGGGRLSQSLAHLEPVPTGVHVILYPYFKKIKILRRKKQGSLEGSKVEYWETAVYNVLQVPQRSACDP
jgi:hypothetical protein